MGLKDLHLFLLSNITASLIPGYVIDYLHGALLGVTKTLLMLWFSPSKHNKGKDFFIGDQVF